jgi:hypothetical protein
MPVATNSFRILQGRRTLIVITGLRPGDLSPHSEMAGSGPGHDVAGTVA